MKTDEELLSYFEDYQYDFVLISPDLVSSKELNEISNNYNRFSLHDVVRLIGLLIKKGKIKC